MRYLLGCALLLVVLMVAACDSGTKKPEQAPVDSVATDEVVAPDSTLEVR